MEHVCVGHKMEIIPLQMNQRLVQTFFVYFLFLHCSFKYSFGVLGKIEVIAVKKYCANSHGNFTPYSLVRTLLKVGFPVS